MLTGKVFDYLATGRRVLAVPDDHGEISGLLRRTGAGVSASNAEEIAGVLQNWHTQWKANGAVTLPRDEAQVGLYSRREQTKRLAGILGEVTGR